MNALGQAIQAGEYSKLELMEFANERQKELDAEQDKDSTSSSHPQQKCEHVNVNAISFSYPSASKEIIPNEHITITKNVFESTNIVHSGDMYFII